MVKIYFVRHGQTADNTVDILTGRNDVELNPVGEEQSHKLKKELENVVFDKTYCSPLKRARQTAEIILGNKNFTIDRRLIERNVGELDGFTFQDIDRRVYWNYLECEGMYSYTETVRAIEYRVKRFIDMIRKEFADKDANILVVSHHGVSRIFKVIFEGLPEGGDLLNYGLKNAECRIFELNT